MKDISSIPIKTVDLQTHWAQLHVLLKKVEWTPSRNAKKAFGSEAKSGSSSIGFLFSASLDNQKESSSIVDAIRSVTGDELLVDPTASILLDSLRTGFSLGRCIAAQFAKTSGMNDLLALKNAGTLPVASQPELNDKSRTCAAITLYSAASYIIWRLSSFESEKVSSVNIPFKGIPEVDLMNLISAANCQLFYIGWYLEKSGIVHTPYEMIKVLLQYCEALISEIQALNGSLKYVDSFKQVNYQLEGTDFVVSGFEKMSSHITVSAEFNRVEFDSIVGNKEAKHAARQLAERLACYDPVEKRNPFQVLGGLSFVRMGYGFPGTGKSLQIAATATLCHDLAERRGIPFHFHPLPDTIISTFQGGSGERMVQWFEALKHTDKIVYAPIDDGENNLENRTRQGVSAGVREVIGVFLRHTEGAGAINHGNTTIDVMTNLPEQIDPAVLSRIQSRFPIAGAICSEDFADQDYLWWRKLQEIDPKFIDINPWPNRPYMDGQGELKSLLELETGELVIEDDRIAKIVHEVRKQFEVKDDRFFAYLYDRAKKEYPGFTSRDVRNIQSAVTLRVMDFNVPSEWFDDQTLFFDHPFDHRVDMLRQQMRTNMKGMSFSDLRYREAVNYLTRVAQISDTEKEREITRRMEQIRIELAARERLGAS